MPLISRLLALLILAGPLCAQPPASPVEALRDQARERVKQMQSHFETTYAEALKALARPERDGRTDPQLERARSELSRWAGTFHLRFAQSVRETSSPLVANRLIAILGTTGGSSVAETLLGLLDDGNQARSLAVLEAFATMPSPGRAAVDDLKGRLGKLDADAGLAAAALNALGRQGASGVAALARERIAANDPRVRIAAISAIASASDDRRADGRMLAARFENESDSNARAALLEAFGTFPGEFDVKIALNEFLGSSKDANLLPFALDAVSQLGDESSYNRALLKICTNEDLGKELRASAARMLYGFGDKKGVMALVAAEELDVKRNGRRFRPRKALGDALFELGAYAEALKSYREARRVRRDREDEVRIPSARCLAALGRFAEAAKELEAAGYTDKWIRFTDEEVFAKMKADPRYADRFSRD